MSERKFGARDILSQIRRYPEAKHWNRRSVEHAKRDSRISDKEYSALLRELGMEEAYPAPNLAELLQVAEQSLEKGLAFSLGEHRQLMSLQDDLRGINATLYLGLRNRVEKDKRLTFSDFKLQQKTIRRIVKRLDFWVQRLNALAEAARRKLSDADISTILSWSEKIEMSKDLIVRHLSEGGDYEKAQRNVSLFPDVVAGIADELIGSDQGPGIRMLLLLLKQLGMSQPLLQSKLHDAQSFYDVCDSICQVLKQKSISVLVINAKKEDDFKRMKLDRAIHGIATSSRKRGLLPQNISDYFYSVYLLLKEGSDSHSHAEGALNFNIGRHLHREYGLNYFTPFGLIFNVEFLRLLSSPSIPVETLRAVEIIKAGPWSQGGMGGIIRDAKTFELVASHYHWKGRNNQNVSCLEKTGPTYLKNALGNAKFFRLLIAQINGNYEKTAIEVGETKPYLEMLYHGVDPEFGLRAYYVDNQNTVKGLGINPEFIETFVVNVGSNKEAVHYQKGVEIFLKKCEEHNVEFIS